MSRFTWAALAALCLHAARADAGSMTPGLVLNTGARHSTADGIAFTPDGEHLYAWGEDKVVRRWTASASGFGAQLAPLRWPIMREQRGCIYALAFSADGRVAVTGSGIMNGLVATIPTAAGAPAAAVPASLPSSAVNWSVAFTPGGRHVVYGNEDGAVYRWTPGAKDVVAFAGANLRKENRVRLVACKGKDELIAVARDGVVRRWSVANPGLAPSEVARFTIPNVFRVALSPDGHWLAASGTGSEGTKEEADAVGVVELIEFAPGGPRLTSFKVPPGVGVERAVRCLAFDKDSARLAVGCQESPSALGKADFFRVTGGGVFVRDVRAGTWGGRMGLTYRADAVAFHPTIRDLLATAGGDDHEVRLWNATTARRRAGTTLIRGPGSCVWGVAFSRDGKSFAWQDERAANPKGESDWGGGPWRVFDVARREIKAAAPAGFKPVPPILTADRWKVRATTSSLLWEVEAPDGTRFPLKGGDGGLYHPAVNQEPRCWTFIPGDPKVNRPLKLAVGHMWGLSVYDLVGNSLTLSRVLNGHEGEVMAVAPSADGKLLLSGGRDQTVCCWSLEATATGNELGASFALRDGKVVVVRVDSGSPAWEAFNPLKQLTDEQRTVPDRKCALSPGDVVELLIIKNESFVYDPASLYEPAHARGHVNRLYDPEGRVIKPSTDPKAALRLLRSIKPQQQYILGKREGGKGPVIFKLTTVRQQPLWRFHGTRAATGREWVIWRPRDFYYDTSANGDQYVGWHVNDTNFAVMPTFLPLERYRGTGRVARPNGFHRRDKVWADLFDPAPVFDRPVFAEIEAPRVSVTVTKQATAASDLEVTVTAVQADVAQADQQVAGAVICVNDSELPAALAPTLVPNKLGRIVGAKVTVPRSRLRPGANTITVRAFNVAGGRGEGSATATFKSPGGRPTLYALCVGINKCGGRDYPNLSFCVADATEIAAVLRQHENSGPFGKPDVRLLGEETATARAILKALKELADKAGPEDWLVVYLSGHGGVEPVRDARGVKRRGPGGKDVAAPGTYFYPCLGYDDDKPETRLTSLQLFDVLKATPCRKLVILDTCHAGGAAVIPGDPARDLTRDGLRYNVIASCQSNQKALEPNDEDKRFRHGFFTFALLDLVGPARVSGVGKRQEGVPSSELRAQLPLRLADVLKTAGAEDQAYSPAFLLSSPLSSAVLHRARGK